MRVAHLSLDFGARCQRRHRVDDNHINSIATYQRINDFKCLFAGIWLRNKQVSNIDAATFSVGAIKRMLSIDKSGIPPGALRIGDDMLAKSSLARRFRAINFGNTASRDASHAKGEVQRNRSRWDHLNMNP